MTTGDPLLAAVERLRASVDALPEPLREPWIVEGSLTNVVVRTEDGSYVVSTGDEYSLAEHIATWDPPTVWLLADLLDEIGDEWTSVREIRRKADALASHLTEGSTTP